MFFPCGVIKPFLSIACSICNNSLACAICYIVVSINAIIKRKPNSIVNGISILLWVIGVMGEIALSMINFGVYFPLTLYGFVALCFTQSYIIAREYDQSFKETEKQKDLNSHVVDQLKKMVFPHQIDKIVDNFQLEDTMPTSQSQACVLAFDIVGSSRIQHTDVKNFLEDSIASCLKILSENYDPELMVATGYRIKEVGDGFLCSFGYPFKTPDNENVARLAVKTGIRFIKVFEEEVAKFEYPEPIYCSMGIAFDHILGYFPRTGTKEYDVFGRSIVLANRYESLRKELYRDLDGSIILLQDLCHKSLGPSLASEFQKVDLKEIGLQVRDDPEARFVHVFKTSKSLKKAS